MLSREENELICRSGPGAPTARAVGQSGIAPPGSQKPELCRVLSGQVRSLTRSGRYAAV
jgi:hypothetical protein